MSEEIGYQLTKDVAQLLERVERRVAVVSSAEWSLHRDGTITSGETVVCRVLSGFNDADMIRHAPQDIHDLCDVLRERDAEVVRLSAELARLRG